MPPRYTILITGGVISSVGKGVTASVIGALLKGRGHTVCIKKFDPYLNVDPGTLSPSEHGEVYVTQDGSETDMDAGHYERIGGVQVSANDYFTMGKILQQIISTERDGQYDGHTVQVVPHLTDSIKAKFSTDKDILICEIGGTVGDIELPAFLEAARQLSYEQRVIFVHVAPIFTAKWISEPKTKPLQHSVIRLREHGIRPDILCCRTEKPLTDNLRLKLSKMCGIACEQIISLPNADSLYELPARCRELDTALAKLTKDERTYHPASLPQYSHSTKQIGIVTKYCDTEAHRSLIEAIKHSGMQLGLVPIIELVDSDAELCNLDQYAGLIIAGGFGTRGIPNKIAAIKYARENQIPLLGICLGMQLAVIESLRAQNIDADSVEFDPNTKDPVICLVRQWTEGGVKKIGIDSQTGGTLRLGGHECIVSKYYSRKNVFPRHRHRYEVNPAYEEAIKKSGLEIIGRSPEGLIEIVERTDHPFFVATQYHPEYSSTPAMPEELITAFVKKCLSN